MKNNLSDRFIKLESLKTPTIPEKEVMLNVYIPSSLRTELKLLGIVEKTSMKDIVTVALKKYIDTMK